MTLTPAPSPRVTGAGCGRGLAQHTTQRTKTMKTEQEKQFAIIEREICQLLKRLKRGIADDYRATDDPDDNRPGMCVTVSTRDGSDWSYQTGDNSYTGGCYGHPHWAVVYLYRRSNCAALAADAVDGLAELVAEAESCMKA